MGDWSGVVVSLRVGVAGGGLLGGGVVVVGGLGDAVASSQGEAGGR